MKIQTALAVPVFSGRSATPSCVLCCYSFVRTSSVPFVLKFVQQALRLLWEGLDKVEPHESVGHELWRNVAPADLGEMAADVEMHQHFMVKKRPHNAVSTSEQHAGDLDSSLALELEALEVPSEVPSVRSIYTGRECSPQMGSAQDSSSPQLGASIPPIKLQTFQTIQEHIHDAVRSVADGLHPVHQHVSTNAQGSKRAHVLGPPHAASQQQYQHPYQPNSELGMPSEAHNNAQNHTPLPMPRPLPLPNQILPSSNGVRAQSTQTQDASYNLSYNSQASIQQNSVVGIQSQHFDHTFTTAQSSPILFPSDPIPISTQIAPVPVNQVNVTEMSFHPHPIPQSVASTMLDQSPMMNGSVSTNSSDVLAASMQYCMAANGDGTMPDFSANGKVRLSTYLFYFIVR